MCDVAELSGGGDNLVLGSPIVGSSSPTKARPVVDRPTCVCVCVCVCVCLVSWLHTHTRGGRIMITLYSSRLHYVKRRNRPGISIKPRFRFVRVLFCLLHTVRGI